jgi:diguanylate cyclase (GGDEF)-like protein
VQAVRKNLRQAAVVARIGGDEFALVIPETTYDSAQVVLERIRTAALEAMRKNNWPVTVSIAALSCISAPLSLNVLLKHVDDMLYAVKGNGKDSIQHEVYQHVRPQRVVSQAEQCLQREQVGVPI